MFPASSCRATACAPAARASATTASASSRWVLKVKILWTPRFARPTTVLRPMPRLTPVAIAIFRDSDGLIWSDISVLLFPVAIGERFLLGLYCVPSQSLRWVIKLLQDSPQ